MCERERGRVRESVMFIQKMDIVCVCVYVCVCLHRIWDIECGACLKLLEGHDDLVR